MPTCFDDSSNACVRTLAATTASATALIIGRHLRRITSSREGLNLADGQSAGLNATFLSSTPLNRRACLGMSWGSNVPCRSRHVNRHWPVVGEDPLPLLPLR